MTQRLADYLPGENDVGHRNILRLGESSVYSIVSMCIHVHDELIASLLIRWMKNYVEIMSKSGTREQPVNSVKCEKAVTGPC